MPKPVGIGVQLSMGSACCKFCTALFYGQLCCTLQTPNPLPALVAPSVCAVCTSKCAASFVLHRGMHSACMYEAWLHLWPMSGIHHVWLPHSVCLLPPPSPPGGSTCALGCLRTLVPINPLGPCKPCRIAIHHVHQLMGCYHLLPIVKSAHPVGFQLRCNPVTLQHPKPL